MISNLNKKEEEKECWLNIKLVLLLKKKNKIATSLMFSSKKKLIIFTLQWEKKNTIIMKFNKDISTISQFQKPFQKISWEDHHDDRIKENITYL